MEPKEALIALNLIEHVGPVRARLAARTFRRRAQNSSPRPNHELLRVRNIGEETAEAIVNVGKDD